MERTEYSTVWEQTASSTVREKTFLSLALILQWRYSEANVARIGMMYSYNRISGLMVTLTQEADQIVQCVSSEATLEAERLSAMASISAWKLYRKLC